MLALLLYVSLAHARIEVHAHRGGRAIYPENSLPAFRHAIELGVDYLELDVRLTKDGRIVVHHDPEISAERCLGPDGKKAAPGLKLREMSFDEIEQYDCGSLGHSHFPGQHLVPGTRIPLLTQVYELIRASGDEHVKVHLEIKEWPGGHLGSPKGFARQLMTEIRDAGFLDRTVIQSFDPRFASAANQEARELGRQFNRKIISPPFSWLKGPAGKSLFRALERLGFDVVPWTANTPEDWKYLIDLGVEGIVTDDPEGLIHYLDEMESAHAQAR